MCFAFNPFGSKNFDAVSCLKYLLETGAVSNLTYLNPSLWASLAAQWYKESACQCRRCRFHSWVWKTPWRGGHGNPLQYSCLGTEEPGGLQSMGSRRLGQQQSCLNDGTQKNLLGLEFCTKNCNLNYFSYN